jgi:hypothetical protein
VVLDTNSLVYLQPLGTSAAPPAGSLSPKAKTDVSQVKRDEKEREKEKAKKEKEKKEKDGMPSLHVLMYEWF